MFRTDWGKTSAPAAHKWIRCLRNARVCLIWRHHNSNWVRRKSAPIKQIFISVSWRKMQNTVPLSTCLSFLFLRFIERCHIWRFVLLTHVRDRHHLEFQTNMHSLWFIECGSDYLCVMKWCFKTKWIKLSLHLRFVNSWMVRCSAIDLIEWKPHFMPHAQSILQKFKPLWIM